MLLRIFVAIFITQFLSSPTTYACDDDHFINLVLDRLENDFCDISPDASGSEICGHDVVHDLAEKPLILCQPLENMPVFQCRTPSPTVETMLAEQHATATTEFLNKLKRVARVTGYVFVGTNVTPQKLQSDGGLFYGNVGIDLQSYWDTCEGGCFGSSSRSPLVAKRFACQNFGNKRPRKGFVYVVLLQDAFADADVDVKATHNHIEDSKIRDVIYSRWFEQEVSPYKGFRWKQVIAYRAVGENGFLQGPIFVRKGFQKGDSKAFASIKNALSSVKDINERPSTYVLPQMTKYYRIEAKHSGMVLDIKDQSKTDVATIVQNSPSESDSQKWALVPAGDGHFYIKSKHSRKFVDVDNSNTDNLAKIIQYKMKGTDNQKWLLEPDGEGRYFIKAMHSGKYLDIDRGSRQADAKAVQYEFRGTGNQRWRLVPVR